MSRNWSMLALAVVFGFLIWGCPAPQAGPGLPSDTTPPADGSASTGNNTAVVPPPSSSDVTPPQLSSTSPPDGATNVALDAAISATFSEPMDPATFTTATFLVTTGGSPTAGRVSYSGVAATFTPSSNLAPGVVYTATITTGARDLAGNPLAADHAWSFTTQAPGDTTPPVVLLTSPADHAANVPINAAVGVDFSEPMDPATLTTATFLVSTGASAVTGVVNCIGASATFTPSSFLTPGTVYAARITTGAKDLAGNALAADLVWDFTTHAPPDTTAPVILSTSPTDNAPNVPLNATVSANFSEPLNPATLTAATFVVSTAGSAILGTVGYSGATATFTPAGNLDPSTVYTATVTAGIKDLAGNALAADHSWQFTTRDPLDTAPPSVIATTPANNAAAIPPGTTIDATFSEAMNPATVTSATFVVSTGGSPIAGTVQYSGMTATFTPGAALMMGAAYTARITTGVTDLAGNPLAADYSWQFTILARPTLCVTPAGGNGCYTKINDALAAANLGDVIGVAGGAYTENVLITKTVTLAGGWNQTFDVLDPAANLTTIHPANTDVAIVTMQGQFGNTSAVAPTIQGFTISGALSGNHGGGLRMQNSDAVVRNNIITANTGYLFGGGIWVQNGRPRFENNQITNNVVTTSGLGGGIELENTQATLIGNTIDGNKGDSAVGFGGGVAIQGGGLVTLINNTITNNAAAILAGVGTDISYGGGVYANNATVTMTGNLIRLNSANSLNIGINAATNALGFGGGVYITGSTACTLTGNTIDQNTAGYAPATGPRLLGGGILIDTSQGQLTGNVISDNRANRNTIFGNGGGLAVTASTLAIRGGQIINNSTSLNCEGYGGGLYAKGSVITLDTTLVQNNCAGNTPFYGMGGGLAFIDTPFTVTDAIIADNRAFGNDSANGGVFAGIKTTNPNSAADVLTNNSPGVVVNNTIANNNGHAINLAAATTLVNNIIVGKDNTTGVKLTGAGPVTAVNNGFFNNAANAAGFTLDGSNIVINPQLTANYHLAAASPMRDAGTHGPVAKAGTVTGETVSVPVTDVDGEPRAMIGPSGLFKVDIGADEFSGPAQRIVDLDTTGADLALIGPGGDPASATNAPNNDWIGYSVLADDVNGDGRDDLVAAAEDFAVDPDNPPFTPGRLFGVFNSGLRPTGIIDLLNTPADLIVNDQLKLQHLGSALAGGDVNGDGQRDLIAGSYQDDGAGGGAVWPTVFVFYGGASLAGTRLLDAAHPADFTLRAPGQDFFAFSAKNALTAADLNNDGKADLIVGDGLANDGALAGAGAVFAMLGGAGLAGFHDLGATPADFTLYGPAAAAGLQSLAVGRLNGGSQNDVAARTNTTAHVIFGPLAAGTRHLSATPADVTITGLAAGGVTVIDLTGDGQDDLILGSGNKLYVLPGPLAGGTSAVGTVPGLITLTGSTPDAVFAVGDVVGDAPPDLIIGSRTLNRAFVIAGGTGLPGTIAISDAAAVLVQSAGVAELGHDVAAGDLDNDGRADLVVGSHFQGVDSHPDKFKDAGVVYVIYGK